MYWVSNCSWQIGSDVDEHVSVRICHHCNSAKQLTAHIVSPYQTRTALKWDHKASILLVATVHRHICLTSVFQTEAMDFSTNYLF